MFGIGLAEIAVIVLVALLFIRPKELPRLFKSAGKAYRRISGEVAEFKEMLNAAGTGAAGDDKPEEGDRK